MVDGVVASTVIWLAALPLVAWRFHLVSPIGVLLNLPLIPITSLALLLGYFLVNHDMPLLWLPVGLLLGGALGNLADRAREGAVIDWIDPVAWPAFNIADACIVIGVFLLLWVVEGRPRRTHTS